MLLWSISSHAPPDQARTAVHLTTVAIPIGREVKRCAVDHMQGSTLEVAVEAGQTHQASPTTQRWLSRKCFKLERGSVVAVRQILNYYYCQMHCDPLRTHPVQSVQTHYNHYCHQINRTPSRTRSQRCGELNLSLLALLLFSILSNESSLSCDTVPLHKLGFDFFWEVKRGGQMKS